MKILMKQNSKNKIPNTNKGITLIALIITIIVMLILVAVTISMAINGGLFDYAGKAVSEMQNAINAEQQLADGKIKIGGKWYESIDDYIAGKAATLSYEETEKDENGFLTANATYKSGDYTAVVPKGFKVSDVAEEKEITNGLVIKDANNNEFVWIPVTEDIGTAYDYDGNGDNNSGYYEPKELTGEYSSSILTPKSKYDSQDILNELYPTNYYKFTTGMYASEYAQMVEKVNEHNGFYIGRYETTIDSDGNIGSKYNTPVLTAGKTFTKDGTSYKYRWYGLYNEQKTADVTGNGTDVQTAMIYGVLWDKAMNFIKGQFDLGNTSAYDVTQVHDAWHGSANGHAGVVNSAQANSGTTGDVALNIWDLESNAYEWTQEAHSSVYRVGRGGHYGGSDSVSRRCLFRPANDDTYDSSRLALYIK